MTRVALLIGGSEVVSDGIQQNVVAMQQVLQHPALGRFAEVKVLLSPQPKELEQGIATLLAEREKYDLLLLYFCGHALKDEQGNLYLTNKPGEFNKPAIVAASLIQDMMRKSQSERQVLILDCLLSGSATSWSTGDSLEDIKTQLLTEGQVLLSAFTPAQFIEQVGIYTRYLVEGMETGAADLDNDGVVSVNELHEYSSRKVLQSASFIQPKIYWGREDVNKLVLTKAPTSDPKLRYRKQVERLARHSEVMSNNRHTLEALREKLHLLPEEARAIEAGVLQPSQSYQHHSQRAEQAWVSRHPSREATAIQPLGHADVDKHRQSSPFQALEQTPQLTRTKTTSLQSNQIAASRFVPKPPAKLCEANPAFNTAPEKAWLLLGLGVASVLALIGIIYGLTRSAPPPPSSPLEQPQPNPRVTAVPQRASPTSPAASTPQLPSLEVPTLAVPTPAPALAEPLFSIPKVPLILPNSSLPEPQPMTAKPQTPAPHPRSRSTTPKPKPVPVQPSVAVPETSPITEPTAPEDLPTSWAEPPPTSAPGSNF